MKNNTPFEVKQSCSKQLAIHKEKFIFRGNYKQEDDDPNDWVYFSNKTDRGVNGESVTSEFLYAVSNSLKVMRRWSAEESRIMRNYLRKKNR